RPARRRTRRRRHRHRRPRRRRRRRHRRPPRHPVHCGRPRVDAATWTRRCGAPPRRTRQARTRHLRRLPDARRRHHRRRRIHRPHRHRPPPPAHVRHLPRGQDPRHPVDPLARPRRPRLRDPPRHRPPQPPPRRRTLPRRTPLRRRMGHHVARHLRERHLPPSLAHRNRRPVRSGLATHRLPRLHPTPRSHARQPRRHHRGERRHHSPRIPHHQRHSLRTSHPSHDSGVTGFGRCGLPCFCGCGLQWGFFVSVGAVCSWGFSPRRLGRSLGWRFSASHHSVRTRLFVYHAAGRAQSWFPCVPLGWVVAPCLQRDVVGPGRRDGASLTGGDSIG